MGRYEHTTSACSPDMAWVYGASSGLLVMIILLPIGWGAWLSWSAGQQLFLVPLVLLCPVPFIVTLLFAALSALTIEIDEREIRWHFRSGFYRRSVPLDEIQRVESWKSHVWHLGVGYLPSASRWLVRSYCVGARKGIQLDLRNGKQLCIETDEPKSLEFALREALARAAQN